MPNFVEGFWKVEKDHGCSFFTIEGDREIVEQFCKLNRSRVFGPKGELFWTDNMTGSIFQAK